MDTAAENSELESDSKPAPTKATSAPQSAPDSQPSWSTPTDQSSQANQAPEPFDPRIILYVSLPALVLVGQLFFTFSRDTLSDASLGPAVMDSVVNSAGGG
jgi:hypothetical protein